MRRPSIRMLLTPLQVATLATLALSARDTQAQATPNGWDAFLGCWVASDATDRSVQTCYLPVAGDPAAVERLTLRNDSTILRAEMALGGLRQPIRSEGCSGFEVATAADDGARVYVEGEVTCGALRQETSALMSLSPRGEMIRVYAVTVGEQRAVVTERMLAVPDALVPASVATRAQAAGLRARGARIAAAKLLDFHQIEDALDHTDAVVVESWMVEATRDTTGFRAPLRDLERLAARNAPSGVIDMAVMVANPQHFDLYADEAPVSYAPATFTTFDGIGNCSPVASILPIPELAFLGGWGVMRLASPWGFFSDCSMYAYWSRNAFLPLSWGYWYPGALGGYGFYRRQWRDRVVYVPASGGSVPRTPALGVVEKGRGYAPSPTRTGSGSTAVPREPARTTVRPPANASAGKASGGGTSSGAASRPRSGNSSGTGRTAQPRDPNKKP